MPRQPVSWDSTTASAGLAICKRKDVDSENMGHRYYGSLRCAYDAVGQMWVIFRVLFSRFGGRMDKFLLGLCYSFT
jgi:hypothetical protein